MAADCISIKQSDSLRAYGDRGIAIKSSQKFEGPANQTKKFEGLAPEKSDSAALAQYTGRQ
jgi:hypothetical protein